MGIALFQQSRVVSHRKLFPNRSRREVSPISTPEPVATQLDQDTQRGFADVLRALVPTILGFACSRAAFLAVSYGSYRDTDSGLFTTAPTLIAAACALIPLALLWNPSRHLSKRTVHLITMMAIPVQVVVLVLYALIWSLHEAHAPWLLALSVFANLSYMATSFFWLRRTRGAHSDVVGVAIFGALAASEVFTYALSLLPVGASACAAALVAAAQWGCIKVARRHPLPTRLVLGSRRDGYFASPTEGSVDSRRFLAIAALGLVIMGSAVGLLRGFPFGDPIAFTPLTRLGYAVLSTATALVLLRGCVRGSRSTMTVHVWLMMQAAGTIALLLFALIPADHAVGAMFANTLNVLLVSYKWYVTVAFMSYGSHDPYYYCIGGWMAVLVPRALTRLGAVAVLGDPAHVPLTLVVAGALLLLSAQVVFVQLYRDRAACASPNPAPDTLSSGLDRLFGLQEIRTFADASNAMAREEVTHIQERFNLSKREAEVLRYYVMGHTQARIATELSIMPDTVHAHIKRIYAKCDLHSRQDFLDYMADQAASRRPSDSAAPPKA